MKDSSVFWEPSLAQSTLVLFPLVLHAWCWVLITSPISANITSGQSRRVRECQCCWRARPSLSVGNTSIHYDVQPYYLLKSDYLGNVEKRAPYELGKEQELFLWSGNSPTVHRVFCCQYAAVGEDPREGAQKGKRCSMHTFSHSLKIINSSCRHEPFLLPFQKYLSEFIWLNVCWEQIPRLCCLPWVPALTCVQECAHTCQIQGEVVPRDLPWQL